MLNRKVVTSTFLALCISTSSISTAQSGDGMLMPILGVYDGDTIHSRLNTVPEPLNKVSIRLLGIDTPEKGFRAKCDKESELAERAKRFVQRLVGDERFMLVTDYEWDKYGGRILGNVYIGDLSLAEELIRKGYAVSYNGEKKTKDWCR